MDKLLLRINEASELIGMGRSKVYDLIAKGILPAVKIDGKSIRVPAEALRQWVDDQVKQSDRFR